MATKKKAKKGGNTKPAAAEATKAKSQRAPATLSQAELLKRTLATMERENWITKKQGQDFMESMVAVVQDALGDFTAVNIGGMVKLVPVLRPRRQVTERKFGEAPDPDKPPKKVWKPSDVVVKAGVLKQGGGGKAGAEYRPSVQKAQKALQKAGK